MNKIWTGIKNHKKTTIAILILLILGGWYYYSKASSATVTTYTVRPVALGTVKTTVTGTGQVSSSQEITVNPQVSGTVTSIRVKNGDAVQAGEILATLDSTTAGFSLKNAQIALAKLQSSNPLTITSNQNSISTAESSLSQSYTTAFNTLTSVYNDMGPIVNNLNTIFYGTTGSPYFTDSSLIGQSYGQTAIVYKQTAGVLFDKAKLDYNNFRSVTSATQSTTTIAATLAQENIITQELLDALKNTSIAVDYIINSSAKQNQTTAMITDQNNISTWLSTASQDSSNISNAISSIDNNTNSLNQAVATLNESQSGSNPLDLASAELSVTQAQYTYDEYTIRAPISGIVGNVTLSVGDNTSPSSVVATVVTKDYISHISLNEVDAAKVTVGQPVNITFNALPNVTATGTVSNVDSIGAVSSGVVSYDIIVSFSSDDPQIKVGMSVNAEIVTVEKDNVVVVPNSAVKSIGTRQYVLIPATGQARNNVTSVTQQIIQTGLSDTTNTEITSGLNVGDLVVTKTNVGTAATAAKTNLLSSLTGGRAGGTASATRGTGGFGGGGGAGGGATGAARTTPTTAPAAAPAGN